jgi:dihydrofolate reductase
VDDVDIIAINHISLDGVIQSPARPDEDTRGGFRHGGWAAAIADPDMGAAMSSRITADSGWLFGRVSYEDMLGWWNEAGGPFRDALNEREKFVASADPGYAPRWPHSQLLTGDVPAEVARLRAAEGGPLVIMGSGALIRSLLPLGLVDELLLFVHPVVIGSGVRMFGDADDATRFALVEQSRSAGGVSIVSYRLAR